MRRLARPVPDFALIFALVGLAARPAPGGAQLKMFTSHVTGDGKLEEWPEAADGATGLAAGNSICAKLAQDAGLSNHASFRAWLSDGTTDAYCNVAGFAGKKADDCGPCSTNRSSVPTACRSSPRPA